MVTYFITGTNRGIGFELVKQLASNPENFIYATVRTSDKLNIFESYSNVHTVVLAVGKELEEFEQALKVVDKHTPKGIDIVIHNAGISGQGAQFLTTFEQDINSYLEMYNTNTVSLVKLYRAIYPYLFKTPGVTKKFVYISSGGGSIGVLENLPFLNGLNGYGMSKMAGNYFIKQISKENLKQSEEVYNTSISLAIDPGTVLTDMGTVVVEKGFFPKEVFISAEDSAKSILDTVTKSEKSVSGSFLGRDGTILPY